MLQVENLDFFYGRRNVLSNISFGVRSGEIVAVLGPNGAGKSTLLRCLNGILTPKRGEIRLENHRVLSFSVEKRACWIAYVPQKLEAAPLSVYEAVLLGRKPYFTWSASNEDLLHVEQTLAELDLDSLADRPTDRLSGGELQKVSLARALVQEPKLLLLDEPISALDLKNQVEFLRLVQNIVRQRNIMAMLCMHDINVAIRYADHFLLLKEGHIVGDVTAKELTPGMIEQVYGLPVEIHNSDRNISFIIEKIDEGKSGLKSGLKWY